MESTRMKGSKKKASNHAKGGMIRSHRLRRVADARLIALIRTAGARLRRPIAYGTFERFIPLPEGFDEGEIGAAYEESATQRLRP